MAACNLGIFGNILNDCDYKPIAGTEVNVTLFNRLDVDTVTRDNTNKNQVKGITLKAGKQAYLFTGFKKGINAGHELKINDNSPDAYKHMLNLTTWGIDAASVKALDDLDDIVAIVELKNKGVAGDGAFQIYGLETGLHKSTDTKKAWDNLGTRPIEFATWDDAPASVSSHVFYDTSYDVTAAEVAALLVQVPLT